MSNHPWNAIARWQEKRRPPLRYVVALSEFVRFIQDSEKIEIDFMVTATAPSAASHWWNIDIIRKGCTSGSPSEEMSLDMDGHTLSVRLSDHPAHNMSIPTENPEQYLGRLRHFEAVVKERLDKKAKDQSIEQITEKYLDDETI